MRKVRTPKPKKAPLPKKSPKAVKPRAPRKVAAKAKAGGSPEKGPSGNAKMPEDIILPPGEESNLLTRSESKGNDTGPNENTGNKGTLESNPYETVPPESNQATPERENGTGISVSDQVKTLPVESPDYRIVFTDDKCMARTDWGVPPTPINQDPTPEPTADQRQK